jgi:ribosomal protein S18 acetylase RimI-like enzyme
VPALEGPQRAPVELHVLSPDDWETWRLIRLQALAEAPYAFGSRLAEWEHADESRWRARLGLEGSHNVVAFAGGTPVGMATGVPGDDPAVAELISMYVAPAARGSGLAERLLDAVERWAVGQGARTLCLDVRADNHPALRAYERQGFAVTGEVERSTPDEPLELRMCKRLGG